jgi:hypothetical protein
VLFDVTNLAAYITASPQTAIGGSEKMEALRAEVAAVVQRPAPDGRVIDETAEWLVIACLRVRAEGPRKAERWLRLAEFLLPDVRADWRRAVEQDLSLMHPQRAER